MLRNQHGMLIVNKSLGVNIAFIAFLRDSLLQGFLVIAVTLSPVSN